MNFLFGNKTGVESPQLGDSTEALIITQTVEVIKETTQCFKEYSICKEQEKTERKRISSQLRAYVKKIDSIKEVELKKIELSHEERMKLLDYASQALDIAKVNGDLRIVKLTFDFINNTINKIGYDCTSSKMIQD